MRRNALLLLCILAGVSARALPAAEAAKKDAARKPGDPLVGFWRGFHTSGGGGYQHRLEIRKQGNAYGGVGLVWVMLGEEQAMNAGRGKLTGEISPKACCVVQTYAIKLEGDTITFKGINAQNMHNGGRYVCDIFSGRLTADGVAAGEAADAKRKEGYFELAREDVLKQPLPLTMEKGQAHDIPCVDGGKYHYRVYIPKKYDPARPWPLLMNFSPGGGGQPLNTDAADEVGWLMVGLTESQNGPVEPECENRDAVLFDVWRRFNVDWKRIYFSGLSGGARAASFAAVTYPGFCAGAILIGAAYGDGIPIKTIPIFYICGQTDMNHGEVTGAYETAKRAGRKANLIVHPGGHDWGRAEDHVAAIRWLEEQSAPKKPPEPAKK